MSTKRFLGNFKIGTKLFLAALSFSLPIAVLVSLMVREIHYDMRFAELEKKGNTYQQSLENLTKDLTEQFLFQTKENSDALKIRGQSLEQDWEELRGIHQALEKDLKLQESDLKIAGKENLSFYRLKERWETAKTQIAKSDPKSLETIEALNDDIQGLIKYVGDQSKLILDPDLDSYYLMDLTLITLPQGQQRLASLFRFSQNLVDQESLSEEDKQELAIYLKLLQEEDLSRIGIDVQTALSEDQNFNGRSESLQSKLMPRFKNFQEKYDNLFETMRKTSSGDVDAKLDLPKHALAVWQESFQFWNQARAELDLLLDRRLEGFDKARLQALILSALAVVLASVLVYFISRSIYVPLQRLTNIAHTITKKTDLSLQIPVNGKDQIGQLGEAFNAMIQSMRRLVVQLSDTTASLLEMASGIKSSSQKQVQGATEQSTAITEISSAIEELASTADQIARNSQTVSEVADQTLESILQIQGQVNQTNQKILNLGDKSKSIGGIIKIIEDLSEQINLLALNAAIEAAHAGEAGKGFAVVASEVRKLSERSGESAQEVRSLVNEIQVETHSAVLGVEESSRQVTHGLEKVQESTQQAREISVATQQQKIATEQVTLAMRDIDQVVQQLTSSTEEAAKTVLLLDQEAEQVQKVISVFKLE